jgi:hypothetical protein
MRRWPAESTTTPLTSRWYLQLTPSRVRAVEGVASVGGAEFGFAAAAVWFCRHLGLHRRSASLIGRSPTPPADWARPLYACLIRARTRGAGHGMIRRRFAGVKKRRITCLADSGRETSSRLRIFPAIHEAGTDRLDGRARSCAVRLGQESTGPRCSTTWTCRRLGPRVHRLPHSGPVAGQSQSVTSQAVVARRAVSRETWSGREALVMPTRAGPGLSRGPARKVTSAEPHALSRAVASGSRSALSVSYPTSER